MKITIVQTQLFWENRPQNIAHIGGLLSGITHTQLIVLPEMFTTGFTMKPELLAEKNGGAETLNWLKHMAAEKKCAITGSVAVEEQGRFYNRLFWVDAGGQVSVYNKRHLFRMGNEDQHYTAGTQRIVTRINQWNFLPQVCYDLRFPVWSRNQFKKDSSGTLQAEYDVLLYVANWPAIRSYPWKQLLIARAIENQCYVVGVNRVGEDGNGVAHSGDSVVVNPRGEIISKTQANAESVETLELDWKYLEEFRRVFPVGLDADGFSLL